jgi:hypothetical protein
MSNANCAECIFVDRWVAVPHAYPALANVATLAAFIFATA